MSITIIANLAMDNGIGDADGNLLFHLPKDLKHFRNATSGKICVFGRKTFESLPKKPLPRRKNYVLTSDENYSYKGVKVIHSIDDILKLAKSREVFICGGGELYKEMLPYADKMIITFTHDINFNARVFFPDFDTKEWKPSKPQKHEADDKHKQSFSFVTYTRK